MKPSHPARRGRAHQTAVKAAFKASGYKVKQLLSELTKTDAFHDTAA
ncbi:hypothetical protein [Sorangium sp. So ce542]